MACGMWAVPVGHRMLHSSFYRQPSFSHHCHLSITPPFSPHAARPLHIAWPLPLCTVELILLLSVAGCSQPQLTALTLLPRHRWHCAQDGALSRSGPPHSSSAAHTHLEVLGFHCAVLAKYLSAVRMLMRSPRGTWKKPL